MASLDILLVEDDPGHAELIRRAFEVEQDATLRLTETLAQARDAIEQRVPGLAIVDLNLADGSGMELLPPRKEDVRFPILIMTSHGDQQVAVDAMRAGAIDYVVKSDQTFRAMPKVVTRALREWTYIVERRAAIDMATLFSRIIDDSVNEIYIFDAATLQFLQVNRGARTKLGYSAEDIQTMRVPDLLPGFSTEEFFGFLEPLESGETERMHFNSAQVGRDGRRAPIEAYVQRTSYKAMPAYVMIAVDTSERVSMEEERARLEMQLRQSQKMQTIGTLSGGIAHDFNNLLTPIIVNTHMVMNDLAEESPSRVRLDRVARAAKRAKELVRQILTFSRQVKHELKAVDIGDVVTDALALVRSSVPSMIEIHQTLDPDCGRVLADETQVHQVIVNLCTNAYHAIGERSGRIDIHLQPVEIDESIARRHPNLHEGRYIELTVADSGHGMDRATLERVFDPFFTTKDTGKGTGLGLSVVHGIVIGHGGGVTIESSPDEGTTFRVYLPQTAAPPKESIDDTGDDSPFRGNETVLFVDDEPESAVLGREMLEPLGYRVTISSDSTEALEIFESRPQAFDVLVTDQVMPRMTGVELTKAVRRIRPELPVVMITGFSETVHHANMDQFGIREFMHKPVLPRELGHAIRRAVTSAGAAPEPASEATSEGCESDGTKDDHTSA